MDNELRKAVREEFKAAIAEMASIKRATVSAEEAAEYVGVSVDTLYELCRKKQFPHAQLLGRFVFRLASIDAWLTEQEKQNTSASVIDTPMHGAMEEPLNQYILHSEKKGKTFEHELPEILSVKNVAELMGWHPNTVYQKCQSGEILSIKVGNSRRIRKSSYLQWLGKLEEESGNS
ncbi:helix-turn-helix domain-containing protein [Gorillibacterium timonense]|uniref:helix-turn-helix domain-containing protein n=1 Tax=Gorillibacterium timonense TaxID=1689269 RepID=UPI00071DF4E6|nr:helix-turn-helix domain-containing protein [Gorillibacterium timonense]